MRRVRSVWCRRRVRDSANPGGYRRQGTRLSHRVKGLEQELERMKHKSIIVRADWDDEANVWVAMSADIDGLATEAPTLQALVSKILVMIGELLQLNGELSGLAEIPVHIVARQTTVVRNPCLA